MSKDAKLGLVIGIAVVIVIAVVFFRKDANAAKPGTESTAAVQPKGALVSNVPPQRRHTVAEGDTLHSLAVRYYDDPSKFVVIYEANREVLTTPDRLTPGTVVVIPDGRD
jgi:nucleoid-associated protein YgaU